MLKTIRYHRDIKTYGFIYHVRDDGVEPHRSYLCKMRDTLYFDERQIYTYFLRDSISSYREIHMYPLHLNFVNSSYMYLRAVKVCCKYKCHYH